MRGTIAAFQQWITQGRRRQQDDRLKPVAPTQADEPAKGAAILRPPRARVHPNAPESPLNTAGGPPGSAHASPILPRSPSVADPPTRRKMLLDLGITGGVAVLLLLAFLVSQLPGSGNWVIEDGLQIDALLTTPEGQLFVRPGQIVTATVRLRNQADHVGALGSFQVAVRGPNACADGWRGRNQDFHNESVLLAAGQVHTYREHRTFDAPGDYFAEPVKQENGKWGGIGPYPRIWFSVVATTTTWIPPPACRALTPTIQPTAALSPHP